MRWSKLKQNVESRMAPGLAGRVRLFTAHYRNAHDTEGRGGIIVDGEEIAEFTASSTGGRHGLSHEDFYNSLWRYLSLSIDDALASDNPLIRGLAMLDARLGKRRLRVMRLGETEHPLVINLYRIRCEAEGIRVDPNQGATVEH